MTNEIKNAASLLGQVGGRQTLKKHGLKHFSDMGKRGGRPKKLSTAKDLTQSESKRKVKK